jgi:prolyl-tRNA editing enzyme YbaK/EbsC (Cys-tRNA(Pro) deacylase)
VSFRSIRRNSTADARARRLRPTPGMIDEVVRYLRRAGIPFRATSYPSPEPEPAVAFKFPPGAQLVDVHVVLVDGSPALAVARAGATLNYAAFARTTGATVTDSSSDDLPAPYRGTAGPLPPLGGVFGLPLFVDEQLLEAARLVFRAFDRNDYVELLYEDLALVERPRVASFARGELPEHTAEAAGGR